MQQSKECDIDDIDDEHYSEENKKKMINESFINKAKDFSIYNPSGMAKDMEN